MSVSKKIWIGRTVLGGVIVAIIATLTYLFVFIDEPQPIQSSNPTPVEEQPNESTTNGAAKTVESAYDAYVKTAYDENTPNPEKALREFKKSMTTEAQAAIGEYSKDNDKVLCTKGVPEDLHYTKPTVLKSTALITVVSALEEGTAQAIVTVDTVDQKIVRIACE